MAEKSQRARILYTFYYVTSVLNRLHGFQYSIYVCMYIIYYLCIWGFCNAYHITDHQTFYMKTTSGEPKSHSREAVAASVFFSLRRRDALSCLKILYIHEIFNEMNIVTI